MRHLRCTTVLTVTLMLPLTSFANSYNEDFEGDPTALWTVNGGPSDEAASFFFNYGSVGIPSAPRSAGGTTRGMKLQANLADGIFGGFSVSPTGKSFVGDYQLRFDWWANFNGPLDVGGNGSTNLSTFGVGTAGNTAQWPGGATDSVWFAATSDGGSASDWRAYSSAAPASYPSGDPVYAAPSTNSTHAHYAGFGGVTAPAAQLALYPGQTGTTQVGAAGMQWHDVRINKQGQSVAWTVDGVLIATIDLNTVTVGGSNIFFGHSDVNAASSTDVNDVHLLFTLIDNIHLTPEPSTWTLGLMAALGAATLGRKRRGEHAAKRRSLPLR